MLLLRSVNTRFYVAANVLAKSPFYAQTNCNIPVEREMQSYWLLLGLRFTTTSSSSFCDYSAATLTEETGV